MDKKDPIETFVEFTHMTDDKGFLVPLIKVHIGCSALDCQSMITIAGIEKVIHGEWIRHIDGGQVTYKCSECVEEFMFHNGTQISDIHYCPNYGAKMDGGEQ